MISQLLVKGLLMTAYGVVLLFSLGQAGIMVLALAINAAWYILDSPVDTAVLFGIIGLIPLALLMGLAWVPKRPLLAGATLVGATLLSLGLDSVRRVGLAEDTFLGQATWLSTGLLGLATMLLGFAQRARGSGRPSPADQTH